MKTQTRFKFNLHGNQGGFALVVVLSLMVLLSILALGMLSLSVVELRQEGSREDMARAKANARIGLMLALGELQKELGPDQRISAPGSQTLPAGSASAGENWVGVYNAWPEDPAVEIRPAPTFRRWLISGAPTNVTNEASIGTTGADENIQLVKAAPVGPSGESAISAVSAGLVPVEDGATAWWVADQNMKARLSGPKIPPSDYKSAVRNAQSSPHVSVDALIDPKKYNAGNASIDESDPSLANIVSMNSAALVATKPAYGIDYQEFEDTRLFHDATADARGLQVNVRKGLLKKDLSFMLEKPWSQVKTSTDYGSLYSATPGSPTAPAGSPAGISLKELWQFYNIWGEIKRSGLSQHPDGTNLQSGTPFLRSPVSPDAARSDPFALYKSATLLEFRILFSLASIQKADGSWNLAVIIDPITKIWNPYNISYMISPDPGFIAFEPHMFPYEFQFRLKKADGTSASPLDLYFTKFLSNQIISVRMSNAGQNVVMRPGEAQIYSKGLNPVIENKSAHYNAEFGYNFQSGFTNALVELVQDPAHPNDPTKKIEKSLLPADWNMQGADVVDVGLVPANNRSVTNSLGKVGQLIGKGGSNGDKRVDLSLAGIAMVPGSNNSAQEKVQNLPYLYPEIPPDGSSEIMVSNVKIQGTTVARKHPFAMFSYNFRTEFNDEYTGIERWQSLRYSGKPFLNMNPKLQEFNTALTTKEILRAMPFQIGVRRHLTQTNVIQEWDNGKGFIGGNNTGSTGATNAITHSIPLEPVISLGAFQNSLANGISKFEVTSGQTLEQKYLWPSISHAIGNSFAPSIIPGGQLRTTIGSSDAVDHSYLANLGLWDGYFLSSISPTATPAYKNQSTATSEQRGVYERFTNAVNPTPLPNSRMIAIGDPVKALADLFPTSAPAPGSGRAPEDLSAKYLMMDGAFNVNSTSVNAWKALLKGLKGSSMASLPALNPPANPTLVAVTDTPLAGLSISGGGEVTTDDIAGGNPPEQWNGIRTLDGDEIDLLAAAIVKQVRLRGPFTSLADFVNRRPAASDGTELSGTLQAAIDDPTTGINDGYRSAGRLMATTEAAEYANPEAEEGAKVRGVPGFVKQGDILTSLAPALTVRGDTFLIRAYGDARDSSNKVTARAWCEATVQRFPEYVDGADAPEVKATTPTNIQLGRQLSIISFRYLSEKEVN